VVAVLGSGAFFGEGCLTGHAAYAGSATALMDSTVLIVAKDEMLRVLRSHHAMSDRCGPCAPNTSPNCCRVKN
jgi:CRP/FNR family cyclic AMP-dependent transcriptional regulator